MHPGNLDPVKEATDHSVQLGRSFYCLEVQCKRRRDDRFCHPPTQLEALEIIYG